MLLVDNVDDTVRTGKKIYCRNCKRNGVLELWRRRMRKKKEIEFNKCLNEAIKIYMKEKGFVYKQVPEYVCSVSVLK